MTTWSSILTFMVGAVLASSCIRAPDVIVIDRRTALEEQAAGSYRLLEEELQRAQLVPHPIALPEGQLAATERADTLASDTELADRLLVRRCLGEALDGTLVDLRGRCSGKVDVPRLLRIVEETNRQRQQQWTALQAASKPPRSLSEVRQVWHRLHLEDVVCGALIESKPGVWESKQCN